MKEQVKLIVLVLLLLSFAPVWRCGLRGNLNFWEFTREHTIFSPHPIEYVPEEKYEEAFR